MKTFFFKFNEKLIKNKPYIWLSKIHIFLPITIIIFIICVIIGRLLPVSVSIYPILISTSVISLIFIFILIRAQYLYYFKNISPKQLNHIFLFNFLAFTILMAIAVIIPFLSLQFLFHYPPVENLLFPIMIWYFFQW